MLRRRSSWITTIFLFTFCLCLWRVALRTTWSSTTTLKLKNWSSSQAPASPNLETKKYSYLRSRHLRSKRWENLLRRLVFSPNGRRMTTSFTNAALSTMSSIGRCQKWSKTEMSEKGCIRSSKSECRSLRRNSCTWRQGLYIQLSLWWNFLHSSEKLISLTRTAPHTWSILTSWQWTTKLKIRERTRTKLWSDLSSLRF